MFNLILLNRFLKDRMKDKMKLMNKLLMIYCGRLARPWNLAPELMKIFQIQMVKISFLLSDATPM